MVSFPRRFAASLALLLCCASVQGATDPVIERRTTALAEQLRCLVCQNQTIADSHAPLAIELKKAVREQLRAGRTEAQVIEFMAHRYGDFVLYRPPVKPLTWLLWGGPVLLLAFGLALLWHTLRGMSVNADADFDSDDGLAGAAGKELS